MQLPQNNVHKVEAEADFVPENQSGLLKFQESTSEHRPIASFPRAERRLFTSDRGLLISLFRP